MTGFTGRLAWQPVGRVAALSVALLLVGGASSSPQANAVSAAQANLGATPISLPCRDSYEDDGVPSQARTIVIGETQTHLFCPEGMPTGSTSSRTVVRATALRPPGLVWGWTLT